MLYFSGSSVSKKSVESKTAKKSARVHFQTMGKPMFAVGSTCLSFSCDSLYCRAVPQDRVGRWDTNVTHGSLDESTIEAG